ncbi:MAG TPA: hypothetical protein DHW63_03635 [Hyphomonadaceae bacterium]|nr:hypothetical protein [Hyphomonadaceae bacterium]
MISATQRLGFWSAAICTLFSIVYVLVQLAEWQGWLGSSGGPESASTPLGLALLLTPSLLLAPAFLTLMIAVHQTVSPPRRVLSHAAIAFATIYAALISIVYYVQLTLVAPRLARNDTEGMEVLVFTPFDSFFYSVDILGYSFMSLATLFAGFALRGKPAARVARCCLIANGMLLPFLALQMYYHWMIYAASLWAFTFPASAALLAIMFQRGRLDPELVA